MKRSLSLLLIVCASLIPVHAQSKPKPGSTAAKPYSCVAGENEKCASDLWFKDYTRLRALQAKYSPPPDMADQMRGMADRLQSQVPAGYSWDDTRQRFVKPAPAVAAQPAPQPPPGKK